MIRGLVYDRIRSELNMIVAEVKDAIALSSEDESHIEECLTEQELQLYLSRTDIGDFGCIDMGSNQSVVVAESVRKKYPQAGILLIVDRKMSPDKYIKPSIMASSLIMRPISKESMHETLKEFVNSCLNPEKNEDDVFVLEGKTGTVRIPYRSIYFVEARTKKVFIRLKNEEYSFFGTLDKMDETLPDNFVRCHRGFLINRDRVKQFLAAENEVVLDDNTRIPVSRSYKNSMRSILK